MDNNNSSVKEFFEKYGGAILGGLIALILCFTKAYKFLIWIVIIFGGIFIGNYIQRNKDLVKEKLKQFIDKF